VFAHRIGVGIAQFLSGNHLKLKACSSTINPKTEHFPEACTRVHVAPD
jgi:hypothetical protein